MWMLGEKLARLRIFRLYRKYIGMGLIALPMTLIGMHVLSGCLGTGVSYSDKCLIVKENNAILSFKNVVIGDEKQVDAILLKKGCDGLVRVTYFNVSKDSRLSISEEDFELDIINGRISLCSTTNISVLTNQYDRCASTGLNIMFDNPKQIVIDQVQEGRITYIGHRDAKHIIWIDAKLNDGQDIHVPLAISGITQKEIVLFTVKRWEKCDYVIQENLYEFGTF